MNTLEDAKAAARYMAENKRRTNASSNWHVVKVYSRLDEAHRFLAVPSPTLFKMFPGIDPHDPRILYSTGG